MILSPSILAADFCGLGKELQDIEKAGLDWVHLDVMDGRFVPNLTFGPPVIKALRACSRLSFDVHLMVEEPERYLEAYVDAGADILVVHAEAVRHLPRTLAEIKSLGVRCGVALNPATPLCALDYVLSDVDLVLIMSVNPGFGGQSLIPQTYDKIRDLRTKLALSGSSALIQVDGGVDTGNAGALVKAGAEILVAGSAFFKFPPYRERLEAFNAAAAATE